MIVKGKKIEKVQGQAIFFGIGGKDFPILFNDFYCLFYSRSSKLKIDKQDTIVENDIYKIIISKEITANLELGLYTLEIIDKSDKGNIVKIEEFIRIFKSKGKDYLCKN